jgi:hypothetical protein
MDLEFIFLLLVLFQSTDVSNCCFNLSRECAGAEPEPALSPPQRPLWLLCAPNTVSLEYLPWEFVSAPFSGSCRNRFWTPLAKSSCRSYSGSQVRIEGSTTQTPTPLNCPTQKNHDSFHSAPKTPKIRSKTTLRV